jgi:heme exporter protein D
LNWHSASEFLAMGGYALYVWGSYAVTLIVLIGEIVALVVRRHGVIERLAKYYAAHRSSHETEA